MAGRRAWKTCNPKKAAPSWEKNAQLKQKSNNNLVSAIAGSGTKQMQASKQIMEKIYAKHHDAWAKKEQGANPT